MWILTVGIGVRGWHSDALGWVSHLWSRGRGFDSWSGTVV